MPVLLKYIFGKRSEQQARRGSSQGTDALERPSSSVALSNFWESLVGKKLRRPPKTQTWQESGARISSPRQDSTDSRGKMLLITLGSSELWPPLGFGGWASASDLGKENAAWKHPHLHNELLYHRFST